MSNDFIDLTPAAVAQRLEQALRGFVAYEVIQGKEKRLNQLDVDLMRGADKLFIVCMRNQQGEQQ